jgi:pimeloyl-ACP methyl ester carboxylesterase
VRDLKGHQAVVLPMIGQHGGRIIDTAGDRIFAEFASVVSAVECAAAIQRKMVERGATTEPERRMQFRIGINLGDVIYDGTRIFGDGVNVAARLEGIAKPGGICVSRQVHEQVEGKLALTFRALGSRNLKNILKPIDVYEVELNDGSARQATQYDPTRIKQEIKYCRAPDGVRIAYAQVGRGPPLMKAATWMNHLEMDLDEGSIFRHFYEGLARNYSLVRYDARGNGMSDWDVEEVSLDAWVSDLEAVADVAGLGRFPLLGYSQGCAVSIAFAVRYPERVSHLILVGGFARGRLARARSDSERQKIIAMETLIRAGWGEDNPAFRQLFTTQFIPDATKEQSEWFNDMQRKSASPECAARYFLAVGNIDITGILSKVTAPTLVIHARNDGAHPVELGRELASAISGAKFIALASRNHIPLEQDATVPRVIEEINLFLGSSSRHL